MPTARVPLILPARTKSAASLPPSRFGGSDGDRCNDARDFRTRTQAAPPSASDDTRANTNAGVGPALTRDVLFAQIRVSGASWLGPGSC